MHAGVFCRTSAAEGCGESGVAGGTRVPSAITDLLTEGGSASFVRVVNWRARPCTILWWGFTRRTEGGQVVNLHGP